MDRGMVIDDDDDDGQTRVGKSSPSRDHADYSHLDYILSNKKMVESVVLKTKSLIRIELPTR